MRKIFLELAESFRKTFSIIEGWTAICVISLIPGVGTFFACLILGFLKFFLILLQLNPIAEWLCHSLYSLNDGNILWQNMCMDLIKIWFISYILISVGHFAYTCYAKNKKASKK